ncbi:MAG: helix-turn-helix transcriptional regulator [Bacteroidales bacterium]|nr:helix-turn-helix transcriptional regulator [Bacteroidales bacterium]
MPWAIISPYLFIKGLGYSDTFAAKVSKDRVKQLRLDNLEQLCSALYCTPNDLMEWTPDNNSRINDEHPLQKLKRTEQIINISKALAEVPIEELPEIEDLVLKRIGKRV